MKKSIRITLIVIISVIAAMAIAVGCFFLIIEPNFKLFGGPTLDLDKLTSYSKTITVLDAYGEPITDALYDNNKIYVKIDDLQDHTVNAFIAIEDKRFYSHKGVDYKRMASALKSNISSRSFREGASTITQQLIKNTHLTNAKTIRRKIDEIRLARELERVYSKDKILESYFNILYFGSGIRGLGTASRVMFDKPASQLTLAQSAALASIINNPSKYSPYTNIENLTARKQLVLKQMLDQGFIGKDDYHAALDEHVVFNKDKQNQFIAGLIKSACAELNCSEKSLFLNNYTIKTAYDGAVSAAVRKAIQANDLNSTLRVLVLDNFSGGIVCDETNTTGYINPSRSPASAIKPFLSYAPALESGLNPLSQILDEPSVFGDYAPKNYKNVYRGYQSLKDCLKYSSNIAAVKLLQQTGLDNCKKTAEGFGFKFGDTDNSLPIALGGMEHGVTLLELADAYRTLACGGMYSRSQYFNEMTDGTRTYTPKNITRRAVNDDTAYLITDMLTECAQTGTAKKLKYSGIIAAKTGTNGDENGNYDCYCIAYTPKNTIAVWLGAKDGNQIDNNITGSTCCNIIKAICDSNVIDTSIPFTAPQSVAYYDVDASALTNDHEVYLADPLLPKRYRLKALLSKRCLPVKKDIDLIDFYDEYIWEHGLNGDGFDVLNGIID